VIILLFRREICGFHRGDNEDGYCTRGRDAVKSGRSISMFEGPWFLHWHFPVNKAYRSPLTSAEIENEQKFTSTLTCAFIGTYFYDTLK
jgi:hypothetical protein